MRATEFITEVTYGHGIIGSRPLYGKSTRPVATLEIDLHTKYRQDREGYRPIRDEEIEKVLRKVGRNRELIMNTIAPAQVVQLFDPEMNISLLLLRLSPEKRGGPDRLIAKTVTPGPMWGKDDRKEIELR